MIHARTRSLGRLLACMHPRLFGCSECVAARRTVYTQFFRCPEGVGSWRAAQSACRGSKLPRRCGKFATKSKPKQKSKVMRYSFEFAAI